MSSIARYTLQASWVVLFNDHVPIGSAYSAVTRAYEFNVLESASCKAENVGAGIEYSISPVSDQNYPTYSERVDNGWRHIDIGQSSMIFRRYYTSSQDITLAFRDIPPALILASTLLVKPPFAFPPDVTNIDPVWVARGGSTCTPVNGGKPQEVNRSYAYTNAGCGSTA